MKSNNGAGKRRLSKLAQLENEVAKLSEQIQANKNTIAQLKKTVSERDLKIQELENKLAFAQQSLLTKAVATIQQCRHQIKNGLDEKVVNPAFSQIQQQIDMVRAIVTEAKELLGKNTQLIKKNIDATSSLVHQCPDRAVLYFEKLVVEPSRLLIGDVREMIDSNIRNGRYLIEQKIFYPGKYWSDKITLEVMTLPTRVRNIFQVQLAEPVMQRLGSIPTAKELSENAEGIAKGLLGQIKSGIAKTLEHIADAVKNSPFWDGKRKEGMAH